MLDKSQFSQLMAQIEFAMQADQYRLRRQLRQLQAAKKHDPSAAEKLLAAIEKSVQRRRFRLEHLPAVTFPDSLPVSQQQAEIAAAIAANQVLVLAGETGSGKTTQLPKICLTLGRGIGGLIGHTQPRRLAARAVAQRIATELNTPLGEQVGFQVRFAQQLGPNNYIKVMTDGILLAEIQQDRWLSQYDTLIIDEAHERSLSIDFLLGYLKTLLPARPDLKLIVTSATLDPQRFARYFNNAPIIEVSGRTYPVDILYRPLSKEADTANHDLIQGICLAVQELQQLGQGDILVFLSGEAEIRDASDALSRLKLPHTEIVPLYARLSQAEQQRIFQSHTGRRIVLATNVAETSLTVPGIRFVIDSGLARIKRYSYRSKIQSLPIEAIAQANAKQRAGRCGRIEAGVCIRLYSEADLLQRPQFTEPEILRSNLASVILQMQALKLGDIAQFPFIDPPDSRLIRDGYKLLEELAALQGERSLTVIGKQLAQLSVDPRLGRMLLAAGAKESCLQEVLTIVSALSIQDPRERPLEHQQAADEKHRQFIDKRSDFLTYLNLWQTLQALKLSQTQLRQYCRVHFLSYLRIREWQDVRQQLQTEVTQLGLKLNQEPADYHAIHKALLTGLLSHIGYRKEASSFLGARNIQFHLFPGSGLFKKPPKWVMAAEIVATSRLYARMVAEIEPEWLESLAQHLIKRSYAEPHWEQRQAQVAAYEKLTLYGLVVVAKRRVNFGAIDPKLAREIFIRSALVEGDYKTQAPFYQHNQALLQQAEQVEDKLRRRDIMIDEATLYHFYEQRIPAGIYSGPLFETWRRKVEQEAPKLLFLSPENALQTATCVNDLNQFPDSLPIQDITVPLSYRFEPGHEYDGVTATLPVAVFMQLPIEEFEWLVPGLLREKVIALIKNLPKSLRRSFAPAAYYADACLQIISLRQGRLTTALAAALKRISGVTIPIEAWQPELLAPHLRLNFQLVDEHEHIIASGREVALLRTTLSQQLQESIRKQPDTHSYERQGIMSWDFGDLPLVVTLQRQGFEIKAYPALSDCEDSVAIELFESPILAERAMQIGLRRLFMLTQAKDFSYLKRTWPIQTMSLHYIRLGSAQELQEELQKACATQCFLADKPVIRTEIAFQERLQEAKSKLVSIATQYGVLVAQILQQFYQLQPLLDQTEQQAQQEIRQQLGRLIYKGFISETPYNWLSRLPVYLRAIKLRLTKLPSNLLRDRQHRLELAALWQAYDERWKKTETASNEHKEKLLSYRWMLEEYRLSLFAQELKTVFPISRKRLDNYWAGCCEHG